MTLATGPLHHAIRIERVVASEFQFIFGVVLGERVEVHQTTQLMNRGSRMRVTNRSQVICAISKSEKLGYSGGSFVTARLISGVSLARQSR
jgi:hypothetical protein